MIINIYKLLSDPDEHEATAIHIFKPLCVSVKENHSQHFAPNYSVSLSNCFYFEVKCLENPSANCQLCLSFLAHSLGTWALLECPPPISPLTPLCRHPGAACMHHWFTGWQQYARAPQSWKGTAFCLPRTNADTQSSIKQEFTSKGTLPGLAKSRAASEPLPSALLVFSEPRGPVVFPPGPLTHPAPACSSWHPKLLRLPLNLASTTWTELNAKCLKILGD